MKFSNPHLLCAFASILALTPRAYGTQKRYPRSLSHGSAVPLEHLPKKTLRLPDLAKVEEEDKANRKMFLPPRFAIPQQVNINPKQDGIWEALDNGNIFLDGSHMWRYVFNSPDPECKSLNFGFTTFSLADGMQLFIFDPVTQESLGPFTHEDNNESNQLWTRVIKSCNVVIEIDIDKGTYPDAVELVLGSVGIGYVDFGDSGSGGRKLSEACNVDVACAIANDWKNEIKAVAAYGFQGSLFCTGALVNNVRGDKTPYFLTAAHCGVNAGNAASVVVYWNFESSTCGGNPNGSLSQYQSGSAHLLTNIPTDFTLLRLSSQPKPEWKVSYAGWDKRGVDAVTGVGIHHPNLDEKRISFEYDGTKRSSLADTGSSIGDGTHIRVTDWDVGTTEPGSSGSPLFNEQHRIIGQLNGGDAACGNNSPDWYGSFAKSWETVSALKGYLDPDQTSALFVDTLLADASPTPPTPTPTPPTPTPPTPTPPTPTPPTPTPPTPTPPTQPPPRPTPPSSITVLQTRANLSRRRGGTITGRITINYSTSFISFTTSGGQGDADLYVRFGSPPSRSNYDCKSDNNDSNEECSFEGKNAQGVYYYMIYAYSRFSGVNFKVAGTPRRWRRQGTPRKLNSPHEDLAPAAAGDVLVKEAKEYDPTSI